MTLEKLHQRMCKVEALYLGATTPASGRRLRTDWCV